ncbi:MAG: LAGLIDADG family homing endonuclease [Candidatus Omnitrophota bacterium]
MVKCNLCNQKLWRITETHLWSKHRMHFPGFIRRFPNADTGPMPWNKGDTKETNLSLLKLSDTLKAKKEWNFSKWQRNRQQVHYRKLSKNTDLAELIGIVLGDGNLYKHLRTESLRVICNSKEVAYIRHISSLIKKIFHKTPSVIKRKNENATVVCLYQCKISTRLGLPCGNKIMNNVGIPHWIFFNEEYAISCLKGLFETDGCFHEDRDNYTRVIEFKNNCARLRKDTFGLLLRIGFNPQHGTNYVRLARRREVYRFKEQIDFRNYS